MISIVALVVAALSLSDQPVLTKVAGSFMAVAAAIVIWLLGQSIRRILSDDDELLD